MDPLPPPSLHGRDLRYLLTMILFDEPDQSVPELAEAVARAGFQVPGRPSKTNSDALRWEIAHRRVVRLARGRYDPGTMPKQTFSWIRKRVRGLHERHRGMWATSEETPRAVGVETGPAGAAVGSAAHVDVDVDIDATTSIDLGTGAGWP